ncbi:hypothetical protein ACFL35_18985 [Candidatus Riflebacteria bacterium]
MPQPHLAYSQKLKNQQHRQRKQDAQKPQPAPMQGNYDPGEYRLEIKYKNFQEEKKTFIGDRRTVRDLGNFISICIVPTGYRCTFKKARISNSFDIKSVLQNYPTPKGRDKQVLSYHLKRGTTSPLFEKIRRQFPDWNG